MQIARWLALAALLPACGDDEVTQDGGACLPIPCPSAAPWDSTTCKCTAQANACDFEGEIARRTGPNPIDCGVVPGGADAARLRAAQTCVLDAAAAKRSFKLRVDWQGTDSAPSNAYTGDARTVSILSYDSDPSGGSNVGPSLGARLCNGFRVIANCQVQNGTLCLDCEQVFESSAECAPRGASSGCNDVGNYEVGKEGGYKPCCRGLREVFHQQPGFTADNTPTCWDPPLRSSFCIQGRCGDGVCDPLESQACGTCTLDCPELAH
ncbi:MAG TPA: hypothetical protein VI299_25640 [Polyangiales bacterium]